MKLPMRGRLSSQLCKGDTRVLSNVSPKDPSESHYFYSILRTHLQRPYAHVPPGQSFQLKRAARFGLDT